MMRIIKKWTVLMGIMAVLGGCDFSSLDDITIVPNVEDEFYLDLWEKLSPTERTLVFKVSTIKEEACKNHKIDFEYERNANRLLIQLNNIIKSLDCEPGKAPATADIDAAALTPGFYELKIELRNAVENTGQLSISGDNYLIELRKRNGVILARKELIKVPEKAIWGYVQYQQTADETIAKAFISDLKAVSTQKDYRNGYYGHFTIDNGTVRVYQQPDNNVLPFLQYATENEAAVKDLLEQYRRAYGSRLKIVLHNWQGQSW